MLDGLVRALRADPRNADVHLLLAFHYYAAGWLEDAARQLADAARAGVHEPLLAGLLWEVTRQMEAKPAK
jgi:hypothetical protein